VYIAEYYNNRIRKVTVSTGIITTIAGSSTSGSYSGDNGAATSATLYNPYGVAVDSSGIPTTFFIPNELLLIKLFHVIQI
jgi:hypothetical protein